MNILILLVVEAIGIGFFLIWLKAVSKARIANIYLAWVSGDQQVSRIKYDTGGEIYYIFNNDGAVVYVGQSKNPAQRIKQHIGKALEDSESYDWIKGEIEAGRTISYSVVAHGNSSKDVNRLEKENIAALLDQGVTLFNVTNNPSRSKIGQYIRKEN